MRGDTFDFALFVSGPTGFVAQIEPVYSMPSGVTFAPHVDTQMAATGSLTATISLVIVRLG